MTKGKETVDAQENVVKPAEEKIEEKVNPAEEKIEEKVNPAEEKKEEKVKPVEEKIEEKVNPVEEKMEEKKVKDDSTASEVVTENKEKFGEVTEKEKNSGESTNTSEEEIVVNENEVENGKKEETPSAEPAMNPVEKVLLQLKNDPNLKDSDKLETLFMLTLSLNAEKMKLKEDIVYLDESFQKTSEAKESLKKLNEAYKKQICLIKEESELRIQEEQAKRAECAHGYQSTMTELSGLLETHTGQNSRLKDENERMSSQLMEIIQANNKREEEVGNLVKGYQLQITLLEHQVAKANIEKSEIKADMTQERIKLLQNFQTEQAKISNLEETEHLLKQQATIYQEQLEEMAAGQGNTTKSFQHFKTQIEKLNKQMQELEKDTQQWRQKYEVSSNQVKKMNASSLDREKELTNLKKKLDTMVKLNKTLTLERTDFLNKIKGYEGAVENEKK